MHKFMTIATTTTTNDQQPSTSEPTIAVTGSRKAVKVNKAKGLVRKLSTKFITKKDNVNKIVNNCSSSPVEAVPSGSCHRRAVQIRIVPFLDDPSKSFIFRIINEELSADKMLRFGRFSEDYIDEAKLTDSNVTLVHLQSKVVSRNHCEIYADGDGKVYLRDLKSSTGTFLNRLRIGSTDSESEPKELKHNDVVQVGDDYQGGKEQQYRAVKMKIELYDASSSSARAAAKQKLLDFQAQSFDAFRRKLLSQQHHDQSIKNSNRPTATETEEHAHVSKTETDTEECCICLVSMMPSQAIFISPCSHAFHFRCIQPLLKSYPGFQCPLCRAYSDLEADSEKEEEATAVVIANGIEKENTGHIDTVTVACASTLVPLENSNSTPTSTPMPEQQLTQEGERSRTLTRSINSKKSILRMRNLFLDRKKDVPITL